MCGSTYEADLVSGPDILGDTIAIMAKGRLRCLGNAVHLKSKFGAGYTLKLALEENAQRDRIKQIVKTAIDVDVLEDHKEHMTFILKTSGEDHMVGLFKDLEEQVQVLGISDMQISMSSLEDVFLDVIKQSEANEVRLIAVTLCSGETVQVRLPPLPSFRESLSSLCLLLKHTVKSSMIYMDCSTGANGHGGSRPNCRGGNVFDQVGL
jgi:hypothetical protein